MIGTTESNTLYSQRQKSLSLHLHKREGVGVEPTAAGSAPPATDFEDQDAHRDTSPPTAIVAEGEGMGKLRVASCGLRTPHSPFRIPHFLYCAVHSFSFATLSGVKKYWK